MALRRGSRTARSEAGFALIEVVVSALIAVTVTGGVIKLLNVSGHAGAEERHRSQAYAVAQEDQARMRGMQIPTLNKYSREETISVGGTPYKVISTANFVNDKTASLSCSEGAGSADYVRIGSEVTWPSIGIRNPVRLESIVTPPSGSLDPTHGTLTISAVNASNVAISGVGVAGNGPSTFAGTTDSTGCTIFADIPEGNYTVTPTFSSGWVEKDGAASHSETVGVVGNSGKTKTFVYDREGSIEVNFKVRGYNGVDAAAKDDSVVYFNNQMTTQLQTVGTPGGTEQSSFKIAPLFPFATSAYAVYAGGCAKNNPTSGEGIASVLVGSGEAKVATLRLHPLYARVWTGKNSSNKGSAYSNADVWVKDDNTECGISRRYTTNSSGQLNEPGFPWGRYDVCADTLTSSSGTGRRQRIENVEVKSLTGTTIDFYLGSGSETVSTEGNCP
jgi:Tfp pilus assembly protein PilV